MNTMNFWSAFEVDGKRIDGSAENANFEMQDFSVIPGGTEATATIIGAKLKLNKEKEEEFYEIRWKLINGEFKDREVVQKISPFSQVNTDKDAKRNFRQANMLARLFLLAKRSLPVGKPGNEHLQEIVNTTLNISIAIWENVGKNGQLFSGNWINEVNEYSPGFEPISGSAYPGEKKKPEEGRWEPERMSNDLNDPLPF